MTTAPSAAGPASRCPRWPPASRGSTTSPWAGPSAGRAVRTRAARVDSLSALERIGSPPAYREFVIGLTSFVRTVGLASTVTASSPHLVGGTSVTESHIFPYAKGILLGRPDDA